MIRFGLAWGPTALWLGVLFVLSAQPDAAVPSWWQVDDTLSHLVLYGVFGSTLAWGRSRSVRSPSPGALVGLGLLWAASDEWHQSFVPGRTPSAADLLVDGVGLLIGLFLAGRLLPPSADEATSSAGAGRTVAT